MDILSHFHIINKKIHFVYFYPNKLYTYKFKYGVVLYV